LPARRPALESELIWMLNASQRVAEASMNGGWFPTTIAPFSVEL
jgi:hypothetical protein